VKVFIPCAYTSANKGDAALVTDVPHFSSANYAPLQMAFGEA
jgi:hypothetical protein